MQRGSDTGNTYSKCMKVDEKELVDMYNSRYHGAEFYSSSYIPVPPALHDSISCSES